MIDDKIHMSIMGVAFVVVFFLGKVENFKQVREIYMTNESVEDR